MNKKSSLKKASQIDLFELEKKKSKSPMKGKLANSKSPKKTSVSPKKEKSKSPAKPQARGRPKSVKISPPKSAKSKSTIKDKKGGKSTESKTSKTSKKSAKSVATNKSKSTKSKAGKKEEEKKRSKSQASAKSGKSKKKEESKSAAKKTSKSEVKSKKSNSPAKKGASPKKDSKSVAKSSKSNTKSKKEETKSKKAASTSKSPPKKIKKEDPSNYLESFKGKDASKPFEIPVKHTLNGKTSKTTLNKYLKGAKCAIVVNVASKCGHTPKHYKQLVELQKKYGKQGFKVVAFPCHQFNQEAKEVDIIEDKMREQFGIVFPIFEKIHVNGLAAHPIFVNLKK